MYLNFLKRKLLKIRSLRINLLLKIFKDGGKHSQALIHSSIKIKAFQALDLYVEM